MSDRVAWPTFGYLGRLFKIYAIAWAAIGVLTVLAINIWFSPIYTSIALVSAGLAVTPFLQRRWREHRAMSVAGE